MNDASQFDESWKEVLREFFPEFAQFFFPDAHAQIDWPRGFEFLDKELEQLFPAGEAGGRVVDLLVSVWLHDGGAAWVLIHVEVQSQPVTNFAERMFVCYYRLRERYNRPVTRWVIYGDDNPTYGPTEYREGLLGTEVVLTWPARKILGFAGREVELEADPNPFALVALMHLTALQTKDDEAAREDRKFRLWRGLLARGMLIERVRSLLKFLQWVIKLPAAAQERLEFKIAALKEPTMELLLPWEQRAADKARQEGRQEGDLHALRIALKLRFGDARLALLPRFESAGADVIDVAVTKLEDDATLADIEALLPAKRGTA